MAEYIPPNNPRRPELASRDLPQGLRINQHRSPEERNARLKRTQWSKNLLKRDEVLRLYGPEAAARMFPDETKKDG